MKNNRIEINNTTDPGIFKSEFEKTYIKKLMKLKNTILPLIMMKIMKRKIIVNFGR